MLLLVPFFGTSQSAEKVLFSVPGGFYEESPVLTLSTLYLQHHIRFTTNGNRPTAQSRLYAEPLLLDGCLYSTSDIYTIQITPDGQMYYPDSVRHCIVIRAAVFDENDSCISKVATNSYFINSLGCDTHGLPTMSLCADSLDLFDNDRGILVPGVFFDPQNPLYTGNYYQTGMNWERMANVEFYENDNSGINQLAGLRTQGNKSRRFQQKALNLYAREDYGKKRFEHRFFTEIPNNSFKHLTLKPFRASWNQTGINDYLANRIAAPLDLETLASRPVVLFLNGEYWGIYFLHEKPDERYLEDHLDVDPEQVTILEGWAPHVDCGNPAEFIALYQWFIDADLKDPEAYAYVASKIDLHNFIDYYIFELFSENTDWPGNNVRCWLTEDGKWRWFFYDGDACLCWNTFLAFDYAVYEGDATYPSSSRATLFFRKLLENENFKQQFDSRFRELLETTFSYSITQPLFEHIKAALAPEIFFQSERFGHPVDVETWNTYLGHTQWFLMKRCESILPVLEQFLAPYQIDEKPLKVFSCYPNPSDGRVFLALESEKERYSTIQLFDVTGHLVFAQPVVLEAGSNVIPIDLPPVTGLYCLMIDALVTKIVRQ